jgi:hypothetical protein
MFFGESLVIYKNNIPKVVEEYLNNWFHWRY